MTDPVPQSLTVIRTTSVDGTRAVGRALGAELTARPGNVGAVLLLSGELGAGKTAFVQGLAEGLGAATRPKSPTFALLLSHPVGRGSLHHLDLYRLRGAADMVELGLPDLFAGLDVVAVEWAERLGSLAPPGALVVRFGLMTGDERRLEFTGDDSPWRPRLDAVQGGRREDARAHAGH